MMGYNYLSEVQMDLLKRGVIDLSGGVDGDMFKYVREAIMRLTADGSPDIAVFFTSSGGGCEAGLDIYDLLSNYEGKVTGRVFSFANSTASIILQACDIRQCTRNAGILIHNPSYNSVFWEDLEITARREKRRKELNALRERIIGIYLQRTGRTRKQIEATLMRNRSMTAEEALKFCLIDEIIRPTRKRGGK